MLDANDARSGTIRRWLSRQNQSAENYMYLPIRGSRSDGTLVLHADIGYPIAVLPIDPW